MNHQELKTKLLTIEDIYYNNYLEKYINLILDNLNTPKEKYKTQCHHIIPKCYFKNNNLSIDDSSNNKVNLLYKDHILAHYYLCLCTKNKLYYQMTIAFTNLSKGKNGFQLNLDEYQQLYEDRKEYSSSLRQGKSGTKWTEEHRLKFIKSRTGKPSNMSEENRLKQSQRAKNNTYRLGTNMSDYTKQLISSHNKGKILSSDSRNKISLAKTGFKYTEKSKELMRLNGKEKYSKPVVCVETGECYNSVLTAANSCNGDIQGVLAGRLITSNGYHWCYLEDFDSYSLIPNNSAYSHRRLVSEKTGKIFKSLKEASNYYNITNIKSFIDNPNKSINGDYLKYMKNEKSTHLKGLNNIKNIDKDLLNYLIIKYTKSEEEE